ncbi:MAG: hypothetical protein ACOYZ7_07005 [Chloroflexota bacterium]
MRFKWPRRLAPRIGLAGILMLSVLASGTGFYIFKCTYDPGPLSAAQVRGQPLGGYASHADFGDECLLCHMPVHCLHATRCETCHADIARQRAEGSGLHGLLPGTKKCQNCHTEHRGAEAVISTLPLDSLASVGHERLTGFSLENHQNDHQGRPQTCDDCHTQHRFKAEFVDCITCHSQADTAFVAGHVAGYGDNCLSCHDGRGELAAFEHDRVFVLQGAHLSTACASCHSGAILARIESDCVGCHRESDLHAGSFGLECARCHIPSDWLQAQLRQHIFALDHGGGGQLACETCHSDSYVQHSCYGCHDHQPDQMRDVHEKEQIADFDDCITCHPSGQPDEAERYRLAG